MATISEIRRPVEAEWRQFERYQHDCLQSDNPLQQEVLNYIAQRSGKQLRPLLVLLAAKLCNPVTDKTFRTAVALEMLHNASLVHDDVVDSSDTRRGAPIRQGYAAGQHTLCAHRGRGANHHPDTENLYRRD